MQKHDLKLFALVGLVACGALVGVSALVNADQRNPVKPKPLATVNSSASLEKLKSLGLNGLDDPQPQQPVEQRPLSVGEIISNIETQAPGALSAADKRLLHRELGIGQRSAKGGPVFSEPQSGGALNDDLPPADIMCHILSPNAQPTNRVEIATFKDESYWFYYSGGVLAHQVSFIAFPLFAGAPLKAVNHGFELNPPSGTAITSPFGIPFWAGDLNCGPWALVCKNDMGQTDLFLFNVNCEEPIDNCPGDGECCEPNGTPGCDDANCCSSVCAADPFCCDTEWDEVCASQAQADPACGCPAQPACGVPGTGDCCVGGDTPYCEDAGCCTSVCAADPFCCSTVWDDVCADEAALDENCDCGPTKPVTLTSTPDLAIPDNDAAGVSDTLIMGLAFPLSDVNVGVDISHTWVGDLCVTLSHDGGAAVELVRRPGLAADGCGPGFCCGCSANNYPAVVLDDEGGSGPIEAACFDNLAGSFTPNSPLSTFDGQSSAGAWTLNVTDGAGADTGNLNAWSITFTP